MAKKESHIIQNARCLIKQLDFLYNFQIDHDAAGLPVKLSFEEWKQKEIERVSKEFTREELNNPTT